MDNKIIYTDTLQELCMCHHIPYDIENVWSFFKIGLGKAIKHRASVNRKGIHVELSPHHAWFDNDCKVTKPKAKASLETRDAWTKEEKKTI